MTEREQCERFPPGARKWVDNVEVEWQPTCIDPPGETGMDPCWPCFNVLKAGWASAETNVETMLAVNDATERKISDLEAKLELAGRSVIQAREACVWWADKFSTTRSALERISQNYRGEHHTAGALARAALKELEE